MEQDVPKELGFAFPNVSDSWSTTTGHSSMPERILSGYFFAPVALVTNCYIVRSSCRSDRSIWRPKSQSRLTLFLL